MLQRVSKNLGILILRYDHKDSREKWANERIGQFTAEDTQHRNKHTYRKMPTPDIKMKLQV